jgi:hypothetical protein
LNHYQHESTCLVVFTFTKQHESNELQETTLRISLQRKKETKRCMKQSKKTQKNKRIQKIYVQRYERIIIKKKLKKICEANERSATKSYKKNKRNKKLFEHGREKCNKNET